MSGATLDVESSAILRVLLEQRGRDEILDRLGDAGKLITSRLTKIECERALLRLAVERAAPPERLAWLEQDLVSLFDRLVLLEITPALADLAVRVAPAAPLRTLDAIHLASWQFARRLDPEEKSRGTAGGGMDQPIAKRRIRARFDEEAGDRDAGDRYRPGDTILFPAAAARSVTLRGYLAAARGW